MRTILFVLALMGCTPNSSPPEPDANEAMEAMARFDRLRALDDSLDSVFDSLRSDPRFVPNDTVFETQEENRAAIASRLPEDLAAGFQSYWAHSDETIRAMNIGYEGFRLFTECAPVKLLAWGTPTETMAESRLRAARIWGGEADPFPSIGQPLVLEIRDTRATLSKQVWDPLSGRVGVIETWEYSSFGMAPEDEMQSASFLIDRFILEYLRVNEGSC